MAAQQGDPIRQSVLRGDHFAGEQEEHHGFQIEPDAVQHTRPDLLENDPIGDRGNPQRLK